MAGFEVVRSTPTTFLDKGGNPVDGFIVFVFFPEFDEQHQVTVPNMNPAIVQAEVMTLLDQRRELAALGDDEL